MGDAKLEKRPQETPQETMERLWRLGRLTGMLEALTEVIHMTSEREMAYWCRHQRRRVMTAHEEIMEETR